MNDKSTGPITDQRREAIRAGVRRVYQTVDFDPLLLRRMIADLGGPSAVGRKLNVSPSAVRRYILRGTLPRDKLNRIVGMWRSLPKQENGDT